MRDRMERLVILPFSVGCISEASVAVSIPQPQPRRSRTDTNVTKACKEEDSEISLCGESMKNSPSLLLVPKSNISTGLNRLFKGFKNLSQIFGEKEEEEEEEMEMEIGCPTDVQHVTHIGWDGNGNGMATDNNNNNNNTNPIKIKGWDDLLSLSSLSDFHHYLHPNPLD